MSAEALAQKKTRELNENGPNGVEGPASIPKEHKDIYKLLRTHMNNTVSGSAYNWVRPELWSFVFGAAAGKQERSALGLLAAR